MAARQAGPLAVRRDWVRDTVTKADSSSGPLIPRGEQSRTFGTVHGAPTNLLSRTRNSHEKWQRPHVPPRQGQRAQPSPTQRPTVAKCLFKCLLTSAGGGGGRSPGPQLEAPQLLHCWAVERCVGEETSHDHVGPPEVVANNSAAAEVLHAEPQVAEALIGLKKGVVCVRAKELKRKQPNNTESFS